MNLVTLRKPSRPARPQGKLALQGFSPEGLAAAFPEIRIEEARKLVSHVHRGGALGEPVRTVRRASIDAVAAACELPALRVEEVRESALDPFMKWLFAAPDGERFEAVRIPLEREGRFSVCVSSQSGCALGCAFCATGRLGLRRNLEAWEIVEEVRHVRESVRGKGRVHGVVFQGMGEPLSNLDRVLDAIAVMVSPSALAIDQRTMTISTAGLPAGIRRLAREAPKIRLAISIGSARPEVRRRLLPVEDTHPLRETLDAAAEHARATGLAPMWALTLLRGVNDTEEEAAALGALAREFAEKSGKRPRVSFIPYNAISLESDDPFRPSPFEHEDRMRAVLERFDVFPHRRYSGGADVGAACGQLVGTQENAATARGVETAGA